MTSLQHECAPNGVELKFGSVNIKSIVSRGKRLIFGLVPEKWYMALYARETDRRVRTDPKRASGRLEEEIAHRIFSYAREAGLQQEHRMLDFGCGTLRVGKQLIKFLGQGNYTGVDISHGAIQFCRKQIKCSTELEEKTPSLLHVAPGEELVGLITSPDFVLAHSVFTHLPEAEFRNALSKIYRAMHSDTILALTILEGPDGVRKSHRTYYYRAETLRRIGHEIGLEFEKLGGEWHPTQTVFVGRKSSSGEDGP